MKHAALSGPADLSRRAGLGAAFAWVVSGFFLIAGLSQALEGNFAGALLDLFCVCVTGVSPFLIKRTGRLHLITHVVLALICLGVIALSVLVRGPGLSGATLMLAVLPLVATLLLGVRAGGSWVLISSATGLTLGVLGVKGLIVDHLAGPLHLFNDHLVLLIFTVALFAVAAVFERRKDEALIQIFELEAQRRGAELEALRAQAEAQLAQAEQFASLGRIAAATAHEVNNPLAYLLANLSFVATNVKSVDDPDVHEALRDAREGAQRIQRIVSDMSAIARPSDDVVSPVAVSDALATALSLANAHTSRRARVRTTLAEVPSVTANEAKLTQVLFNLVLNATSGLPEGKPDEHEIAIELSADQERVLLEIHDSGAGASARGLSEVSLAVVLGEAVVRSFGGSLSLESTPGRSIARLSLVPVRE